MLFKERAICVLLEWWDGRGGWEGEDWMVAKGQKGRDGHYLEKIAIIHIRNGNIEAKDNP